MDEMLGADGAPVSLTRHHVNTLAHRVRRARCSVDVSPSQKTSVFLK
jgi:hypothetical protein